MPSSSYDGGLSTSNTGAGAEAEATTASVKCWMTRPPLPPYKLAVSANLGGDRTPPDDTDLQSADILALVKVGAGKYTEKSVCLTRACNESNIILEVLCLGVSSP